MYSTDWLGFVSACLNASESNYAACDSILDNYQPPCWQSMKSLVQQLRLSHATETAQLISCISNNSNPNDNVQTANTVRTYLHACVWFQKRRFSTCTVVNLDLRYSIHFNSIQFYFQHQRKSYEIWISINASRIGDQITLFWCTFLAIWSSRVILVARILLQKQDLETWSLFSGEELRFDAR